MACQKLGVWAAQSPLSAPLECQYPLSGKENDQLGQTPVLWAAPPVQLGAVIISLLILDLNFLALLILTSLPMIIYIILLLSYYLF